jgi:nucleotide-binding universal stress UspA family protein
MQALQTVTNISFKNILFLTDFSEASEGALAYALGLARHYKAELFPAHACDPVVLAETTAPNVVDEVVKSSREQLNTLIKDKDVVSHPLFVQGNLESALTRWINENGIDLVVIGTHGRHGMQRFVLGSTAEFIFRNATCPVLTVGPHVAVRPYHGFAADSIMFPTDLGPHAEFAATYALSFAREAHGRLLMMHVVTQDEAFQHDRTPLIADANKKLQALLPPDAREFCQPEIIVEVGDPDLEVIGYAEKERPDLIVLGLPHDKKFSTHFAAGVTYRLVSQAPCPVLTVRDQVAH